MKGLDVAGRLRESIHRRIAWLVGAQVTQALVAAAGLLVISCLVHRIAGEAAASAAMAGVIAATAPAQPGPRRGKFTQFLPALLLGTPLFLATLLLRDSPAALLQLLAGATFLAFLAAAWGKRGLPVSASMMFALLFALAAPRAPDAAAALRDALAFFVGASLCIAWGTLANTLLNPRYRVLALADLAAALAGILRAQGLQFTMAPHTQQRLALAARLMKLHAELAEPLQGARNLLLENPAGPRELQRAAMLVHLIDLRDHLVACALDLEALHEAPEQQPLLAVLGTEIQALAGDLERLADALRLGSLPPAFVHERPSLAAAAAAGDVPSSPLPLLARALARRVGHLHDEVAQLVGLARGERAPGTEAVRHAWPLFVSPARWSWAPLRALWRLDAPALRHAVRAALAIATGHLVGTFLPWSAHDAWILMTIAFVLRANLAQTLQRRDSRVAGTLLGCVLAGMLLYARLSPALLLVVIALAYGIAHAFVLQHYSVTAAAATVLALLQVHLLDAANPPAFELAERLMDTLIGVGIAWAFSYVLPSWERMQLAALVERALAAQARHARLALALGRVPAGDARADLAWRLARRDAHDSLAALVQAVGRALSEPRSVQPPLAQLERVVGRSWQLLAQLTAAKNMLLRRRELLDLPRLQEPLDQAARAIAAELAPDAAPHSGGEPASPCPPPLDRPAAGTDAGASLLRRLELSVRVARALRADAALLAGGVHASPRAAAH